MTCEHEWVLTDDEYVAKCNKCGANPDENTRVITDPSKLVYSAHYSMAAEIKPSAKGPTNGPTYLVEHHSHMDGNTSDGLFASMPNAMKFVEEQFGDYTIDDFDEGFVMLIPARQGDYFNKTIDLTNSVTIKKLYPTMPDDVEVTMIMHSQLHDHSTPRKWPSRVEASDHVIKHYGPYMTSLVSPKKVIWTPENGKATFIKNADFVDSITITCE